MYFYRLLKFAQRNKCQVFKCIDTNSKTNRRFRQLCNKLPRNCFRTGSKCTCPKRRPGSTRTYHRRSCDCDASFFRSSCCHARRRSSCSSTPPSLAASRSFFHGQPGSLQVIFVRCSPELGCFQLFSSQSPTVDFRHPPLQTKLTKVVSSK